MNYKIADALNVNVTCVWLITQMTNGEPADKSEGKGGTSQTQIAGITIPV